MLSGRYIHLFHVLDLGVTWLNRKASVAGKKAVVAPQKAEISKPEIPKSEVKSAAFVKPKPIIQEEKPVCDIQAAMLMLPVRSAYAVTENTSHRTVWLTLRSDISQPVAQMDKGDFGLLLTQLIFAAERQTVQWQTLPNIQDFEASYQTITQNATRMVLLGEDLHSMKHHLPVLKLPHPAKMLHSVSVKKETWQKIKDFFNLN